MVFQTILSGVLCFSVAAQCAAMVWQPDEPVPSDSAVSARDEQLAGAVRELLQSRCWSCHGAERREAGLRLDDRALILNGGDSGLAVMPGLPDSSRLLQRVRSVVKDEQMPPEGERLSEQQIQLLTEWVERGLPWPKSDSPAVTVPHWAWQPVKRDQMPPAASIDAAGWARNEIDLFVLKIACVHMFFVGSL